MVLKYSKTINVCILYKLEHKSINMFITRVMMQF